MTDEPKPTPPPSEPGGLQFDRAESAQAETTATAAPACSACRTTLQQTYYLAGPEKFCTPCQQGYLKATTGGSRAGRFFRATVFGTGAGLVGALVHYLVYRWTGWTIGLIAIFIGWAVGVAVRNGSDGRGGWLYQGLAMFLTYAAIVGMFVPDIAGMIQSTLKKDSAAQVEKVESEPAAGAEPAPAPAAPEGGFIGGFVALIVMSLLVMAIAFAAPFLAIKESFIFLIILGFSLYEAWKINKRLRLEFKGPFQIAPPAPEVKPGE